MATPVDEQKDSHFSKQHPPQGPSVSRHETIGCKPEGAREFTPRAVAAGLIVAAVMGASYPYIVLKLGFGPNVSVVAAFFGFLGLGLFSRNFTRWENNIVQTAGTSAAQTAFMCVLLAAFDMLSMNTALGFSLRLTPLQSFAWLTAAGVLGVLLAVPMRQHFVVDEKLIYADGVAAAETIIVLDSRGKESQDAARFMGLGTLASALLMILREESHISVGRLWSKLPLPDAWTWGYLGSKMYVGVSYSLLSLGSGMLVGMRINASMLLGTILSWVIAAKLLLHFGIIERLDRTLVLRWVMWPATGMLVAGGLTALFLRWRLLVKTFRNLSGASVQSHEFPLRWVIAGITAASIALIMVQKFVLGMPVWYTVTAIIFSIPLMLVGLRVLGETNWGPISALSNMMQGVFGILSPGNIAANMTASGTTGTIAVESEALMQDYKAGLIIGSSPKYMTFAQLLGVPVGAAAVSWMYPLLRSTYGIGGEKGLSSPISVKWAGFAELLSKGISSIPTSALWALVIFTALGILLTILEQKWKKWIPSPTGVGIGMLVPGIYIVTMFLGGLIDDVWRRKAPKQAEQHSTPLASGLIAGEAIVAVVVPLLILTGILSAN